MAKRQTESRRTNHNAGWSTAMLLAAWLAVGFLCSPASAWTDAKLEGTNPAQWRLIWKENPDQEATLGWSTKEQGAKHWVTLRQEGHDEVVEIPASRNGRYADRSNEGLSVYYHLAKLEDLQPATKYHVQMHSDGDSSPKFHFITAPDEDVPVQLIYGGDSRTDLKMRRVVNERMRRIFEESPHVIAFAHGGDYIVDGYKLSQWLEWMSAHELTTTEAGRLLPILPARGNHDRGEAINQVFDFPDGDRDNWYATDLSPQVRWITLNTETSAEGRQAEFLEAELKKARPNYRWLLVQYHRPAWPAVKGPSSALGAWVPLFEQYNVDLVCESDGHVMKRTVPIRNGKLDETGVVYVGEGGLGVPQRSPKSDRWFLQPPGFTGSAHHVQVLSFDRDRLRCQTVDVDGKIVDDYAREPR